MTADVIVVGAGPAGAVAATVLARAGARVRLLDRSAFPREKLCGDTVNPGTFGLLRRLGLAGALETRGLPVRGMLVTGEGGVCIDARYPVGLAGRALTRSVLDWSLVEEAVRAGASFEPGVIVQAPLAGARGTATVVGGVLARSRPDGSAMSLEAPVTIAADGSRSTLAATLGLARPARRPRRWAVGAYFADVPRAAEAGTEPVGEMHIRRGGYIGVAPLADGRTNVCFVKPSGAGDPELRDPLAALRRVLAGDRLLRDRFAGARPLGRAAVLGPLAVEEVGQGVDGLLVAGDAGGFIDPMTGDGLRFAVQSGVLAADAALGVLAHGWVGVHDGLRAARRREFQSKWRFNRMLRALVAAPLAVRVSSAAAALAPAIIGAIVARAGDCDLAD